MGQLHAPALAPLAVRLQTQFPTCEVLYLGFSSCGIRLTIDHPDGVSAQLTSRIASALRPLIPRGGLEVSSPGPQRPLQRPEHFAKCVGRRIRLTTELASGRASEYGQLTEVSFDGFHFVPEYGEPRWVKWNEVASARAAK